MVLIVMNLLFLTSGDLLKSPDAFSQEEQTQDSDSIVYGEIYQCKLLNEYLTKYKVNYNPDMERKSLKNFIGNIYEGGRFNLVNIKNIPITKKHITK